MAVLELKLEEAVAYGETTRSYLSEAYGNILTEFVKVEDMTQRDETHREKYVISTGRCTSQFGLSINSRGAG